MHIVNVVKDSFIECAPFKWGLSLFSFGCNLQCSFCKGYNYESVTNPNNIIGDAIEILKREVKPCHDCVVFIGGEPTIWGDSLIEALRWCKDHKKKTKIFSNGLNHEMIREINLLGLSDAWSIDLKGTRDHVGSYVGRDGHAYYDCVMHSIQNIVGYNLPLEIRTTYFEGNIADKEKIREVVREIEKLMREQGHTNYYKYFEQQDFRERIKKAS